MDILSIGNSFSQDAQRYLNRIAKADGVVLNTFNLFTFLNTLYVREAYSYFTATPFQNFISFFHKEQYFFSIF